MQYKIAIFGLFYLFSGLFGETVVPTATRGNENVTVQITRQSRASKDTVYRGLIVCAFRYEAGCFLDVAKQFLDSKRVELLAEADAEVARASGSPSSTNKPSQVAQTIEKLFTDLAGLFREGFANIFGVKDDDDELATNKGKDTEENDDDEEEDDKKENTSRDIGARSYHGKRQQGGGKGIIKRVFKIAKILIIGLVVVVKLCVLIKIVHATIKWKYMLIAFGYLLLNATRVWLDAKYAKKAQKVIYYKHADHQHHYEPIEDDWLHESWNRHDEEEKSASVGVGSLRQYPLYGIK
ncbi:uncharacterized protein [Diabrotica undecimpunctata]|uniref:uncharacterized protein isoform X3 n=1 Tax=Diabrotica undecimpunctata TaxID=50387 RepID=UPI003B63B695